MGSHELFPGYEFKAIRYERRPLRDAKGALVEGLYTAWIQLDNPGELNSYTTDAIREVILGFRRASDDPAVVAAVFTGAGDRAFCSGGNTREYATVYAGHPTKYRAYMRLFNDMVSAILLCDKPTICRVNGLRVGGGQEIGMACDFSVAQDMARFGQAGPKHGSAPDGGATDFLPLFVGIERAIESVTLCEPWSAHKAARLGLITECVPVLKVDGAFVPNPLVETSRYLDPATGRVVHGEPLEGEALAAGKKTLARGSIDLAPLDASVDRLVLKLAATMPDCMTRTLESLRKHKLEHWDANKEGSRAWLALNMMTEAKAGFRAFHFKPGGAREIDFFALRREIAAGRTWDDALLRSFGVDDSVLEGGKIVTDAFLVSVARLASGSVARVSLSGGKGNIITRAAIAELSRTFHELGEDHHVHAVLLTAEGQSFCYGASVPEHAPGVVERMLPEFHELFRAISAASLPVVAAVRGKCLGGGLELALAAHRIVVAEDAQLGFPEVTLGVFPPVAAALLPLRVSQPVVDRLVVLGDLVKGTDAVALGLADECAPSALVESRALLWAERYRELSGVAVRYATRASRTAWDEALGGRLARLEHLYLDELMATADAREGIAAFLDRRPPRWSDA